MRRVISIFLLLISPLAAAEDFRDGMVAMANGDFAQARRIWTPLAEKGDSSSQMGLGQLYESGAKGVKQDLKKALHYLTQCEPSLIVCTLELANMYNFHEGVKPNASRAAELYSKVIATRYDFESGIAEARTKLGVLYLTGRLGERNRSKAEDLIRPAAESGYHDAQLWLGVLCEGIRPEKTDNLIEAAKWYRLALASDSAATRAMSEVSLKAVEKKLTDAERNAAANRAHDWRPH
jgi:uncharacterized protein